LLKLFGEWLYDLKRKPERMDIEGQIFVTESLTKIPQPGITALKVRSLSGIVQYVQENYDKQPPVMVHVASPTNVVIYSTFNRDMQRNVLVDSEAMLPKIPLGGFLDSEQFNVILQSCFVQNETRDMVLSLIGNIVEENVKNTSDNGVSQKVVAKTGVAVVDNVVVPNPVTLKPFRTFSEIAQPESAFILRLQEGPSCGLFEADGGAWKIAAMQSIKEYLDKALATEIEDELVVIIA
jgi:hypothetical protein